MSYHYDHAHVHKVPSNMMKIVKPSSQSELQQIILSNYNRDAYKHKIAVKGAQYSHGGHRHG